MRIEIDGRSQVDSAAVRSLTAGLLFVVAMYKVPHDVPRPWDLLVLTAVGAVLLWALEAKK